MYIICWGGRGKLWKILAGIACDFSEIYIGHFVISVRVFCYNMLLCLENGGRRFY